MHKADVCFHCIVFLIQESLGDSTNLFLARKARIVGGSDAMRGEFAYQGLLLFDEGESDSLCGCSVLNSKWAITAAHCTFNAVASELRVYLGRVALINLTENFDIYAVRRIHQHELFNATDLGVQNDISLLEIDGEISFNRYVAPIALPNEEEKPQPGQTCFVTGWGELMENGTLARVLQKAKVPVLNNSYCEGLYRAQNYETGFGELCAGLPRGGIDACFGDSGGPLACTTPSGTLALQGIVSFGKGCGRPGEPSVYTRVSFYLDWIKKTMDSNATDAIRTNRNHHLFFLIAVVMAFNTVI